MVFFADDQILLARSDNDVQYSVHELNNNMATNISMEINMETRNIMKGTSSGL
jgi:hypothetical protein